jgi:hypothetical protein
MILTNPLADVRGMTRSDPRRRLPGQACSAARPLGVAGTDSHAVTGIMLLAEQGTGHQGALPQPHRLLRKFLSSVTLKAGLRSGRVATGPCG